MTFEYIGLDRDSEEVRLMGLTSSSTNLRSTCSGHAPSTDDDKVRCHLWHFSMRDIKSGNVAELGPLQWSTDDDVSPSSMQAQEPGYVALSYCWGDPNNRVPIEVNGTQAPVTTNLEAAMRILRDQQPMQRGCAIWIDALCINQRNLAERVEQVGRMRDIYKSARSVVIWVGNEGEDGAKATALIRTLAAALSDGSDRQLAEDVRNGRSSIAPGSWAALEAFMQRPYWSRTWILQEVSMGNRLTPIFCGTHMVTWGQLYDALYTFTSRYIDLVFSCITVECDRLGIASKGLMRNPIIQLNRQQGIQQGLLPRHLLPILDIGRRCLVSDDRDRVYGMLALLPPELSAHIMPDYTKGVGEVYASFAKAMILSRMSKYFYKAMTKLCRLTREL